MKSGEVKKVVKDITGFSLATWINFILGFLLIPVISRVILPDLLGYINLYITYLTGITYFCYAGLDQVYCRFYYDKEMCSSDCLFLWCLKYSLILTSLICIGLLFNYNYFSSFMIGEKDILFIISLCVGIFSTVLLRFYNLNSRMAFQIKLFSIQTLLTGIGLKLLYIFLSYISSSKQGILIGFIIYYIILLIVMSFMIFRNLTRNNETMTNRNRKVILRFAIPLIPSTVLAWLNSSVSSIMVSKYLSIYDVGIFANTLTIAAAIQIIREGFGNYWTPFVYQNYKEKKEELNSIYGYIIFLLLFIGLAMLLFIDVIYIIVGNNYAPGKIIFPLLLIAPVITTISSIADTNSINLANKTHLFILTTGIGVISNIVLSLILMKNHGLMGAALANAISVSIPSILNIIIGRRFYKLIISYKKTILGMLIFLLTVILNVFFVENIIIRLLFNLIGLFVFFAVFYKDIKDAIRFCRFLIKKKSSDI